MRRCRLQPSTGIEFGGAANLVRVKAGTIEHFGFAVRGEGIAALATVLLEER